MHLFYLICSTTPKRFAQRFIFPNPSFAWRYSAVIGLIGWFHLKQSAVFSDDETEEFSDDETENRSV